MISKLDLKVVRKGYDYLEVGRPKTTNVYEDLSNLNPYSDSLTKQFLELILFSYIVLVHSVFVKATTNSTSETSTSYHSYPLQSFKPIVRSVCPLPISPLISHTLTE